MTQKNLLSLQEAAQQLKVRTDYVQTLIQKNRLHFVEAEKLDAHEVEKLAQLMNKLRAEGIATLVDITASQLNEKK